VESFIFLFGTIAVCHSWYICEIFFFVITLFIIVMSLVYAFHMHVNFFLSSNFFPVLQVRSMGRECSNCNKGIYSRIPFNCKGNYDLWESHLNSPNTLLWSANEHQNHTKKTQQFEEHVTTFLASNFLKSQGHPK
jgi:hypothetical protein